MFTVFWDYHNFNYHAYFSYIFHVRFFFQSCPYIDLLAVGVHNVIELLAKLDSSGLRAIPTSQWIPNVGGKRSQIYSPQLQMHVRSTRSARRNFAQ